MSGTSRPINVGVGNLAAFCTLLAVGTPLRAAASGAEEILNATGVKGGLIVHVGCGDGKLTAALRANDSYLVHGLGADAANVEKARAHIRSVGLCGKVSIERWSGPRLPYADNLVNLLVVQLPGIIPSDEVLRVLAPHGVAYIKRDGKWARTVKPRPDDVDEWTHALHDADNNAVAADSAVGPPRHLQWVGGPKWGRSHDHLAGVSVVVSTGGRIFYIVDEGPIAAVALPTKWMLVGRDAYNGVVLWKRPIGTWEGHLRGFRSGPAELQRRLVAVKDRVYATLGYGEPVTALDAATGKTVKTYDGTDGTLEIVHRDGVLFLVAGDTSTEAAASARRRGARPAPRNKQLLAIRADTCDLLWKRSGPDTAELMPLTLAVAGGRVFFRSTEEIVCLNAASGQEQWRAPLPVSLNRPGWSTPTLVVHGDVVLTADRAARDRVKEDPAAPKTVKWVPTSIGGGLPGELIAFSAKTGQRLWHCKCCETYNAPVDVLVADGLVWTGELVRARQPGITVGRDPITGEIKRKRPADKAFFHVGMTHHRCYRNKATPRYLLLGRAGVEFIDLASGEGLAHHWVRGVCQYGVVPCNGLLYAPSHACACYIQAKLNGFNALAAERSPVRATPGARASKRVERGPAYQEVAAGALSVAGRPDDWPTYRHDPARSGSTALAVPTALKCVWRRKLGGRLSSLVVADGRIFVASVDTHTVHAVRAKDGGRLWSYAAGGRVDSPPTIYKGLALFGSADGWVYCLRASDGKLVWRFRAAPEDRRVVAYGQLESVWPVHGNVLVCDGVAYFAAGRSAYLDGGITLYRLDPVTGKKLSETRIDGRDPGTGHEPKEAIKGFAMEGALPDVFSYDGTFVYMRHLRFDRQGVQLPPDVPHLHSSVGFLDDTWWHRTYWIYGAKIGSGWGGWPRVGNQVPAGRLLVVDGASVYGYGRINQYATHGSHVGLGKTHYRLFACAKQPKVIRTPLRRPLQKPASKPGKKSAKKPKRRPKVMTRIECRWSQRVGLQARAMVLAGKTLFVAGPPDAARPAGPPAETEGRRGGMLCAFSTADGKKLAECELESEPAFDGMAAAGGCLYLALQDGQLVRMGKRGGR